MVETKKGEKETRLVSELDFIIDNFSEGAKDTFLRELALMAHFGGWWNSREYKNFLLKWKEAIMINGGSEKKEKIKEFKTDISSFCDFIYERIQSRKKTNE